MALVYESVIVSFLSHWCPLIMAIFLVESFMKEIS